MHPTCETCGELFHFCPNAQDVFCRCDMDASRTEAENAINAEFDRLQAEPVAVGVEDGGTEEFPW